MRVFKWDIFSVLQQRQDVSGKEKSATVGTVIPPSRKQGFTRMKKLSDRPEDDGEWRV